MGFPKIWQHGLIASNVWPLGGVKVDQYFLFNFRALFRLNLNNCHI